MKNQEILDLLKSISSNSERLIEFLFFFYKSSYKHDINFENLIKNHLYDLGFDSSMIENKCALYNNVFKNCQDNTYTKALNSAYLRYFIKDLSRKVKFVGKSQNQVKKLLASRFVEVIYYICISNFRNLFQENYFNILMEVIEDDDLLANEFRQSVEKELIPFIVDKDLVSDNRYDQLTYLANRYIGAYLIEYSKDDCNQETLAKHKTKFQKLLLTDLNEVSDIFETLDDPTVLELPKSQEDKARFDLNDEFIDNYNLVNESPIPIIDDNYHIEMVKKSIELFIDEMKDDQGNYIDPKLIINLTRKAEKSYEKYFRYDKDEYDDEYKVDMLSIILKNYLDNMQNKETQFTNDIGSYFEQETSFYCDEFNITDKYEETIVSFEYTMSFLNILAYSLQYGSAKLANDIVNQFKEILDSSEACRKNFSDLLGDFYQNIRIKATFPPTTLYRNQIIIAVLMEINTPTIAKKIRKILINDERVFYLNKPTNRKLLDEVLIKFNKAHARLYFTEDSEELFSNLHELAVIYILSYLKDKTYIAPYTTFVRFTKDEIAYCDKDYLFTPKDIRDALENDYNIFNTEKELDDLKNIEKIVDQIIDDVEQYPHFYQFFQPYNLVMLAKNKDSQFYNDLSDLKSLFIKYRDDLIYIIYNYYDENLLFSEMSLEQQVEYMIHCCVNLSLIDEIDRSEELLINIVGVENTNIRSKLETKINKLNNMLVNKEKEIEILKTTNNRIERSINDTVVKETAKVSESYQSEISKLKKQLKAKDKQIEILQENQSELYKLRELLFNLQTNENDDIEVTSVDLSKTIKGKSIVIVGGHIKLVERLKSKYPSMKFMGNDRAINEDIISNADYVFIFYNFFNHSDYRKVMSAIGNKTQWDYLNTTNLERVENFIYEKI